MKKASPVTYLQRRNKVMGQEKARIRKQDIDLNIFVVTFNDMKQSQKKISGGDPYYCKKCKAVLNKFSIIRSRKEAEQVNKKQYDMKQNQSLWECQFCSYPNIISIDKQQIPSKQDVFYLLESDLQNQSSANQSTMVFCIDASGSMNTTSEVQGKIDLKFGLSQEQIDMLKAFMEPGDQAQFNFLPGNHNKNKTFVSRKQCIMSAIQSQLQELKKTDPHKRVGFVTFNNQVTAIGDDHAPTVNIVGDKLNNQQAIIDSLNQFKLTQALEGSYQTLIGQLAKQEAKGQTALGPGIVAALEIASKGSPGSTVILCTDGLANIGVGLLEPLDEQKKKFYTQLAQKAKAKNISVNIMTIKGEGCKMEVIGQLAELTNGNVKVVNPQKLADDFANVLKDEVVGLNVDVFIKLHKAMNFRNQDVQNLMENGSVLKKNYANATVNTKISFQYEVRCEEDLKFMEINIEQLKKVPFQTQIIYTSPKGGKFLRVVSSESKTTMDKKEMQKQANIGVVHQRVTSITANLYSKGDLSGSKESNDMWSDYVLNNFKEEKYQKKQQMFSAKNARLNKALQHKARKLTKIKQEKQESSKIKMMEQEDEMNRSLVDSDEDQQQLMDNLMEKQNYSFDQSQQKQEKVQKSKKKK